MEIRWFGQAFFEITSDTEVRKGTKIYIDPYGVHDDFNLTPPGNLEAEVVLISHNHPDHNNIKTFKNPGMIIDSPGEYSVSGVDIKGLLTFHDNKSGQEYGSNVVYIIETESVRVVHLGDIGHLPSEAQAQKIDGVDVLMIPVGGAHSIGPKDAVKIVKQLEPKIVIPMHYKMPGLPAAMGSLDDFCKEMGICATEPVLKLTVKKANLIDKDMEVVILAANTK